MGQFEIVVEKHPDGYVAYPIGMKGVVVGEGDTYDEALADVKGASPRNVRRGRGVRQNRLYRGTPLREFR
jgi:hypothetical protein